MSPTADPIAMMLAAKAGGYLDRIKDIDVEISNLRTWSLISVHGLNGQAILPCGLIGLLRLSKEKN